MTRADATPWTRSVESTKTTDAHRAKLAVVYVRQSTPQQVAENRESLARQYALADHAISLGWPTERVLVIDEDLGLSGRTADMRLGFQRLLAEVSMDHVGLVLGLEMSRLLAYGSYRIRRCDAFSLAEDARLSRPFEGSRPPVAHVSRIVAVPQLPVEDFEGHPPVPGAGEGVAGGLGPQRVVQLHDPPAGAQAHFQLLLLEWFAHVVIGT